MMTSRMRGLPVLALLLCLTAPAVRADDDRTIFLGGGLSDEETVTFTATVAASGHPGAVLLDTPKAIAYVKPFLTSFQPERIVPVGSFPASLADLERRLGMKPVPPLEWNGGRPTELWKVLFPRAEQVVVCPAEPRGLLLQAACLAGSAKAPLFVVKGEAGEGEELRRRLTGWQTRKLFAAGTAVELCKGLGGVAVIPLADAEAVAAAHRRQLRLKGPIQTLVVANPADVRNALGGMSVLAPWVALQRRAVLLLTNEAGENVSAVVRAALAHSDLHKADALLFVAGLRAIPTERRPNPIEGKDTHIEMEPLTPTGTEPYTFATGRLFHDEPGVIALLLARQRLLRTPRQPQQALIVSNPGGGLPLLELFSRNTVQEMHNAGYQTQAFFGKGAETKQELRRLLPDQDVFLWEGHYRTMVDEYGFPTWTEPLRPGLIFLQSCLALNEKEAQPLLQRGALAVVGSANRTYSATGGAFTLCYFDALMYDGQTLGGALRQAKNFLLAYTLLKDKRLGGDVRLSGANQRSAWAFTLWGDPTLHLPRPEPPEGALPTVRHTVRGNTIVLTLPDKLHNKVTTPKYQVQMLPNSRLAGLLTKVQDEDDEGRRLVPFVFAEVQLPKVPPGKTPRLRSRLPERNYVFCWDARRSCGYLLVTPRARDEGEVRFRVEWDEG
jgi:hypothetical protein